MSEKADLVQKIQDLESMDKQNEILSNKLESENKILKEKIVF